MDRRGTFGSGCNSASSMSDSTDCHCPPASLNDGESESDDEIVSDSVRKETKVVTHEECRPSSCGDVRMLNSQLQVGLDAVKLDIARLTSHLEIRDRELEAYKQMLDITTLTICLEKENAVRRGSVRPTSERSSFARRVSEFFVPTRRSSESCDAARTSIVETDPAALLDKEMKKIQMQTRIWYAVIEIEAARNIETKKQLEMTNKSYDQLLIQFQQVDAQLESCKKELNECSRNGFSLCAELRDTRKKLTVVYEAKLQCEHEEAEKLKAELRLESSIKRDLIAYVGETAYQSICRRARMKLSSSTKPFQSAFATGFD